MLRVWNVAEPATRLGTPPTVFCLSPCSLSTRPGVRWLPSPVAQSLTPVSVCLVSFPVCLYKPLDLHYALFVVSYVYLTTFALCACECVYVHNVECTSCVNTEPCKEKVTSAAAPLRPDKTKGKKPASSKTVSKKGKAPSPPTTNDNSLDEEEYEVEYIHDHQWVRSISMYSLVPRPSPS